MTLNALVRQMKESVAKLRTAIIIVAVLSGLVLLVNFIEIVIELRGGK